MFPREMSLEETIRDLFESGCAVQKIDECGVMLDFRTAVKITYHWNRPLPFEDQNVAYVSHKTWSTMRNMLNDQTNGETVQGVTHTGEVVVAGYLR